MIGVPERPCCDEARFAANGVLGLGGGGVKMSEEEDGAWVVEEDVRVVEEGVWGRETGRRAVVRRG